VFNKGPATWWGGPLLLIQQFSSLFCLATGACMCLWWRIVDGGNVKKGIFTYPSHSTDHPDERWFYVNGICSDVRMATLHAHHLHALFNRPITVVYNPTFGPLVDLTECILGRNFHIFGDVVGPLLECVVKELKDDTVKEVILIGHSQGGVIVCNAVDELIKKYKHEECVKMLKKIKVFTFASASRETPQLRGLPFYEHFANRWDIVSRVGVLSPDAWYVGAIHVRNAVGHFLSGNYLSAIVQYGNSNLLSYLSVDPNTLPPPPYLPDLSVRIYVGLGIASAVILVSAVVGLIGCVPCVLAGIPMVAYDVLR